MFVCARKKSSCAHVPVHVFRGLVREIGLSSLKRRTTRVYVTAVDRALGPQTERMNFDAPVMLREKKNRDTARAWSRDRLLGHAHIRACAEARQHYLCACVRVSVPTSGRSSCCRERHASSDG